MRSNIILRISVNASWKVGRKLIAAEQNAKRIAHDRNLFPFQVTDLFRLRLKRKMGIPFGKNNSKADLPQKDWRPVRRPFSMRQKWARSCLKCANCS